MGIFTRFRDIVNSNINSMLDKAEDPEKLIQHMIYEMEDTLVELKAACAGVIAGRKRLHRRLERLTVKQYHWEKRARIAVEKGLDGLAREALKEKHRLGKSIAALEVESMAHGKLVDQYREDVALLEEKLAGAREKQRALVHRHIRAHHARQAQEEIRKMDTFETIARYEDLEERIERLAEEADLVDGDRQARLESEFEDLLIEAELDKELASLRAARQKKVEETA